MTWKSTNIVLKYLNSLKAIFYEAENKGRYYFRSDETFISSVAVNIIPCVYGIF